MNLLSSTAIFSFFTLISRILGYLRDILIAIFLGASILADVFFVAFRLPNTFRRLFAEGTFNAAFIPSYTKERLTSDRAGKMFADDVLKRKCLEEGAAQEADMILDNSPSVLNEKLAECRLAQNPPPPEGSERV